MRRIVSVMATGLVIVAACGSDSAELAGTAMVKMGGALMDAGLAISARQGAQAMQEPPAVAAPPPTTTSSEGRDEDGGDQPFASRPDGGSDGMQPGRQEGPAIPSLPPRTVLTAACNVTFGTNFKAYFAQFDTTGIDVTSHVVAGYRCNYVGNNDSGSIPRGDCVNVYEPIIIEEARVLVRCGLDTYPAGTFDRWQTVKLVVQ